jgi:pyruvate formate lyase activating enzyme
VVRAARESGCASIAYTYTEPTIYLEYALDVAAQAKEAGIKNVFVTNGYMTPEALEEALPFMDAANVDLKFSDDEQYLKHCGGKFSPVVDSIGRMHRAGVWVEVTTLVIPGENDQPKALEKIAGTIAGISPNIPWHVSRYHPDYKFEEGEPTAEKTLERAQVIGRHAGLAYVYAGNIIGWGNDTNCPSCGVPLITRAGIALEKNTLKEGKCPGCGAKVPGVFA